ncbi:hypothetical protein [Methanoculleus chikugoensis]|uniref:hypothetical protein n=1 Tax=Methanoculleus chikugoensis TaxID=118126 RepID=UPI0006D09CD1|nr:hypothetical protein [Methanoculleus chikugoensis]
MLRRTPDPISCPIASRRRRSSARNPPGLPAPEEERTDHDRFRKDRDAGEGGDPERGEDLILDRASLALQFKVARLSGNEDEVPGPVMNFDRPAPGEVALRDAAVVARERYCPIRVQEVRQSQVEPEQIEGL